MMFRERLGFRTSGMAELPLGKALAHIAEAGFCLVEFCMEHPDAMDYRGDLCGLGLSAVSYHGKRDDYATRRRHIALTLEKAQEMGTGVAVLGSPVFNSVSLRSFLEECEWVMDRLPPGVRPAWEPEPGTLLEGIREFGKLAEELGPEAGLNLDFGHAHLEGLNPGTAMSMADGRILHCHIEDVPEREHVHLLPGDGVYPWKLLVSAMAHHQYSGPLVVDLFALPSDPREFVRRAHDSALRLLEVN
jgi:sugar phosphate isomerase/epimerase